MANFFEDNDDLQYYFDKGIDWEPLVRLIEHDFKAPEGFADVDEAKATYRDMLAMIGELAADEISPRSPEIDREGARMVGAEAELPGAINEIFERFKELELHGLAIPRELGGFSCPMVVHYMASEVLARADIAVMTHYNFHSGIALALLLYSMHEGTTTFDSETNTITSTRFEAAIREILAGDAWGSMDITEPNAGSDMAALSARGEQDDEGNWYVSGQKIFLTSGHGKYHIVIARTEDSAGPDDPRAGLGGLSLFMVPAYEDDGEGGRRRLATLDRLEEKLGHHGSATAAVTFDRTPAHLIGGRGDGFKLMLLLMNNARVGVGFEAIGVAEAAYRLAVAYAAERRSMGKAIDRHEMIADFLDEMRTDLQGLRALAVASAYHEEMHQRAKTKAKMACEEGSLDQKRLEREARRHARRTRRVTPMLKLLAAERAVDICRRSIQIHGGVGYTSEYRAEQLLRDAMVLPIYEGTTQIQGLMIMKDSLTGIMKNPQAFIRDLAQARWRALSARDPLERRVARLQSLGYSAQQHLMQKTVGGKLRELSKHHFSEWLHRLRHGWDPKRDFAYAMLHAERLGRLLGDVAIAEALLDQSRQHSERRELLERFLDRAEIRVDALHEEITTRGDRLIARLRGDDRGAEQAAE
ncbi:MAG: acyl-CoA dehydrogenase family protein [Myxococcales bacterium]|nr:acyl-CoA dehydrogenase family protein [Myxococcales bacterium]MCB9704243.1 acyl-CoA dehydrogenase family protein [Myxococcales bacterium]